MWTETEILLSQLLMKKEIEDEEPAVMGYRDCMPFLDKESKALR